MILFTLKIALESGQGHENEAFEVCKWSVFCHWGFERWASNKGAQYITLVLTIELHVFILNNADYKYRRRPKKNTKILVF